MTKESHKTTRRKRSFVKAFLTIGITTITILQLSPVLAFPMYHPGTVNTKSLHSIDHSVFQSPTPLGNSSGTKSHGAGHSQSENDTFGVRDILKDVLKEDEYEAKEEAWHVILEPALEIGKTIGKTIV